MTDRLTMTFAALADPTRRAILARLARSEASVTELAKPFDMSMRAVSKHIRVLENAGLISRQRVAQQRPSHLALAPLKEVDKWLASYRRLWTGRMDRVAGVLDRIKKGELDDPRD